MMDLRRVEARLMLVLNDVDGSLPADELADMRSLVAAGEPGVALENFCAQLEEYDVVVPEEVVLELREIAAAMEMSLSPWMERLVP
jgi:hypothetical protein